MSTLRRAFEGSSSERGRSLGEEADAADGTGQRRVEEDAIELVRCGCGMCVANYELEDHRKMVHQNRGVRVMRL